jgi:hypothetical protein
MTQHDHIPKSFLQYIRPFYRIFRPLYNPYIAFLFRNFYVFRNILIARKCLKRFSRQVSCNPDSLIEITYDHKYHPPTYGDFFIILMTARFLALSGYSICFNLIDTERRGLVWQSLGLEEQDFFVKEEKILIERFLPSSVKVHNGQPTLLHNEFEAADPNSPTFRFSDREVLSFYQWSPYFLNKLICKYKWKVPKNFLLERLEESVNESFVTWNVRKSSWAKERDTSILDLQSDFMEIRLLFPNHDIIVLSSEPGLHFAFKTLFNLTSPTTYFIEDVKIMPQPIPGFTGAIDSILSSDFYFQRAGGGISVISLFSKIPFLLYLYETSSAFMFLRKRFFIWNQPDQICKRMFFRRRRVKFSRHFRMLN